MEKKWLELIIEVREGLAEDAAARILEAGATAVEERDGLRGASLLITHIALEDGATRKLRAIEALLATMGVEKSAITLRNIEDQDWVARSRGHFKGEAYGERLWVRPPWDESETPPGRIELMLEPGLAFGTGRHPSTRLALLAIERHCTLALPERMVDLGCGSGILGVAALLYGARRVTAFDLDPAATQETTALAERNGVRARMTALGTTLTQATLEAWWGRVDFIAANIFLDALCELAPQVLRALAPGGRAVLSGIGYEGADTLARIYQEVGFTVEGTNRFEEWASVEVVKP
ncbi:MAG: 50S ribosomal protein L11 methyltransferase [Nitrospinae bacterium]|nr:50S ribosomal protein L11 methyltransferase [Nitrospinota bacterium]